MRLRLSFILASNLGAAKSMLGSKYIILCTTVQSQRQRNRQPGAMPSVSAVGAL